MKEGKGFKKIINWILNILLIVFFVVVVNMIVDRFFGNSPTDFQLILWISGFFCTAILKLFNMTSGINREVEELKIAVRNGFEGIKKDIGGS